MDSRGAVRGTLGVSTRNPSANIRVCLFGYVTYAYLCMFKNTEVNVFWISLWFQPPLKPRSTGICERWTWSQSSSTSTAQLSTLLLSHLSCILFARAQRCGGKKDVKMTHAQCKRGHRNLESLERLSTFLDIVWHCNIVTLWQCLPTNCMTLQHCMTLQR